MVQRYMPQGFSWGGSPQPAGGVVGPAPSPQGGGQPAGPQGQPQQPAGGQPPIPNAPQFNMMMGGGIGAGREQYTSKINDLQRQLMMAQINGAPPQTIASLTMALQQAQQAYQEAGYRAMADMMKNRPQPGLGGVSSGGRPPVQDQYGYQARAMNDWNANMQLLAQLWGLGGGGGMPPNG